MMLFSYIRFLLETSGVAPCWLIERLRLLSHWLTFSDKKTPENWPYFKQSMAVTLGLTHVNDFSLLIKHLLSQFSFFIFKMVPCLILCMYAWRIVLPSLCWRIATFDDTWQLSTFDLPNSMKLECGSDCPRVCTTSTKLAPTSKTKLQSTTRDHKIHRLPLML